VPGLKSIASPRELTQAAIGQGHAQPFQLPARGSVPKAARAAGVGGDGPSGGGVGLSQVWRVELT
jgi:hypothetical protein